MNNNDKEYSVRASQTIYYYGVGGLVNFSDQILMIPDTKFWIDTKLIEDKRLKKSLKADALRLPKEIQFIRFPEWYYCPNCKRLKPVVEWINDRERIKGNKYDKDPNMTNELVCPYCNKFKLIPSRFLTVCENGHIHDFPWIEWAHVNSEKPICDKPDLRFTRNWNSESEGFETLRVECSNCGAGANLHKVQEINSLKRLEDKLHRLSPDYSFKCKGTHPQSEIHEECDLFPRVMIRGASSIYYPLTYTSLVIPIQQESLEEKITKSNYYNAIIKNNLETSSDEKKPGLYSLFRDDWIKGLASEINENQEEIEKKLDSIVFPNSLEEYPDASTIQYKFDEYDVLAGLRNIDKDEDFFVREEMDMNLYDIDLIKSISLIRKVRVVKALIGFSRINSVNKTTDPGFVSVRNEEDNWFPAYEVKGEGIFVEFDENKIKNWIDRNPEVQNRVNKLSLNQLQTNMKIGKFELTAKFLLIHTLSHLLMTQLSYECGYNLASLSERLYVSEKSKDGKDMAGIFIYTSSGDSEGTLGGLVRQGEPDTFPKIFKDAIDSAQFCSNDPICSLSNGQGNNSLNLSACHACCYIPETSCEVNNTFLDRAMIVGTLDNRGIGIGNYYNI